MQDNSDQFATPEEEATFNDEVIVGDETVEEAESHEDVEESEEEAEDVKPKKPGFVKFDTPEQQARADQLTREKHENFRKAEAERKRADALQRELEELKRPAAPKEVGVPSADPITEPELFARQQQERDKYIREHTKYESETESRNQAKQEAETQRKSALVDGYIKNMGRLKINPAILHKASNVCAEYGLDSNHPLTEDLLEDKDGPAIVKYLADNVEHLAEIANMKPTKALAYIEREIRAKLNVKQQSKAPPPTSKVSGTRTSSQSANGWDIS